MISFPGQMEASPSPDSDTNNNLKVINNKNNWPYNILSTLDVESKKYLLRIGENLCRTFGPAECKFLPVLIKSWPDDRQDRHFC